MVAGMPSSTPAGSPLIQRPSEAWATDLACSWSTRQNAFSIGLIASIRRRVIDDFNGRNLPTSVHLQALACRQNL